MNPPYEGILQDALTLPEEQRVQLVDALIQTLSPEEQITFDDELLAEVERRCDEVDAGLANTHPWAEVKQRIERRLNRNA